MSELLELFIKLAKRLSILFGATRLGKQQLRFTVKNRQRSAQFVRCIGNKLAQRPNRGIHPFKELINSLGQQAQLVLTGRYRQRCPETLAVSDSFSHQRGMIRERRNWREAFSDRKST